MNAARLLIGGEFSDEFLQAFLDLSGGLLDLLSVDELSGRQELPGHSAIIGGNKQLHSIDAKCEKLGRTFFELCFGCLQSLDDLS